MDIAARIKKAIDAGEVLTVRYDGGSQRGAVRRLAPIRVTGGLLWARCLESNREKNFKIDRITSIEDVGRLPTYEAGREDADPASFDDAIGPCLVDLRRMGWEIVRSEDGVGLHRYFKNGKLRKGADVEIRHVPLVGDEYEMDDDGNEKLILKPATRPWQVRTKEGGYVASYKSLRHAIETFVAKANETAERLGIVGSGT